MKKLQQLGLTVTAVIGLVSLSGVVSVTTAVTASAAANGPNLKLSGYTYAEADVSLPADSQEWTTAACPTGDVVVGGGGYQGRQALGEDIGGSYPTAQGSGWIVFFNNEKSFKTTGVAVAICAAASSLANYSVQLGALVTVPADGEAQGVVTCPSGTLSLGGGAASEGKQTYQGMAASAPYGTNGWRTYLASAGSQSTEGQAAAVCATKPAGWAQVSSDYVSNPAGTATTVTVNCPAGTKVLGGGPFNSSADPTVTVGLTTSLSSLKGWHSKEDNASSATESVDEWAVCADAVAAS
jgi:hypothetical protein